MMKKWISFMMAAALCLTSAAAEQDVPERYEFEDGTLSGSARVMQAGATGWVEGLAREGDGVSVDVTVPGDGFYDLTVCQAGVGGYKENHLLLDGEAVGSTIANGQTYQEHTLSHIFMSGGEHTVTVSCYWGNVRLDYLTVTASEGLPADLYDVPPTLCCPSPSPEAQALMDWMCDIYGERMISGQYLDEYQYGAELEAVASVTGGLRPAMVGLDMMNYSPASVSLGSWPTSVDQAIRCWQQGHILTMCWHWVAPEKYIDTTGNNWWSGYRTENTSLNLKDAMNGRDPEAYDLLIRDMDAIAAQLRRLQEAGVPVLWRPLHEASGGWFWWGAFGPEPYIALYRLMYDRFTNVHGLNNLIWVWNGQDAAWYPGDDVVDVIGTDIYAGTHAHDSQSAAFLKCMEATDARKLIMLTECGCVPSPIKCLRDNVLWSAWAVWCYEYVLADSQYNGAYTAADTLKLFYEQEHVVTLRDVPALGRTAATDAESGGELTWTFADAEVTGSALHAGTAVEIRGNEASDTVSLTVSVPEDAEYVLSITQAGIGGYKENDLYIDGECVGKTVVQGEAEEECVFGPVQLTAGTHEIRVSAVWGWVSLRSLSLTPGACGGTQRVEFEDGELLGNVRVVAIGGEKYVELSSNDEKDGAAVTVTVDADGYYDLTVIQSGIGGYKENYLAVDGIRIGNTVVQGTDLEECVTGQVYLAAGTHTVTVTCFWGWTNLDALLVTPSAVRN